MVGEAGMADNRAKMARQWARIETPNRERQVGTTPQTGNHETPTIEVIARVTPGELRYGRAHRGAAVLRADGSNRAGHGLRASQSDGPVLLDLPDGAHVHVVP